ncbi:SMI1/KNR4 family protein [Actinoplanes sp. NPDC048796]|uniref:SMI1/KNR4 family protein n=1 Tax=unclassified Actinoplanes TaxID=2626549 RepID=UPI0033F57609
MVLVDWRDLVRATDGYLAQPGVPAEQLAACESLTHDLRRLYEVTDGFLEQDGQRFFLWPLADLTSRNEREWRDAPPARRELVAIGDDGTGARICVPRDGNPGVFLWDPVSAAPHWLANDLGDFWVGWTQRRLTTIVPVSSGTSPSA